MITGATIVRVNRWQWCVVIHTDTYRLQWCGFDKRRHALAFLLGELGE